MGRQSKNKKSKVPRNKHPGSGSVTGEVVITPISGFDATAESLVSSNEASDSYPSTTSFNVVHAAAPNTLRIINVLSLQDLVDINDETIGIYDKAIVRFNVAGRVDGFPAQVQFFLVKGPNTFTFTASDKDPSNGVKTGVAACCAGGSQITPYRHFHFKPIRENGAWVTYGNIRLDITKLINRYTAESSNLLAQGRSQSKYYLIAAMDGTAAATDVIYKLTDCRSHLAKRKLIT